VRKLAGVRSSSRSKKKKKGEAAFGRETGGYLGADGAAVEEGAEREGEPGEVEVEPLGAAGLRLRPGRGRHGEPRPAGAERRGVDVVGRAAESPARRQAERPRGGAGGHGCGCHCCCSRFRSLRLGGRLGAPAVTARWICRRGVRTDGWMGRHAEAAGGWEALVAATDGWFPGIWGARSGF
jgi:hypothetical protein